MIPGLIPLDLYEKLLDLKNYQNRISGVEELKHFLTGVDMKSVPSGSIEKFIHFLPRLLDDINFKVLCGTLQVLNLLIQKLGPNVEKYFKQLVSVGLKTLGDTRNVVRSENMSVFQQLTKAVAPQQILDLITGDLQNKNSRVREDVLNIVMAAMLAHPKKEFDVHKLCFEVAPCLADSKRRVRHASLELFAVFDVCLDTGKKQPLMKAVDMVELNEDADGLMAAVQTRRSRRVLPKLSPEGTLEYGLVVPEPGEWSCLHHDSGADLDWVMNGGRISSAKSNRTEPDCTRLQGYGSLGSLTGEFPLQRRIVSAGKGKNKLPWEMSLFSSTATDQHGSHDKCPEQVAEEDFLSLLGKLNSETNTFYSTEFSKSSRNPGTPVHLRRSGSLNIDANNFKGMDSLHSVAPKGHTHSRNLTVTPRSFLLPSYPLSTLPGKNLTPTLPRRQSDLASSMSNTWPNKKENSPPPQDNQPVKDTAGAVKGAHLSSRCSPQLLRASLMSPSMSSFRRALSGNRTSFSVSPVVPKAEQVQSYNGQRSTAPGCPDINLLDSLSLDPDDGISMMQDPQDEDPPDIQEMQNSLRSVRNSAAKKKAKLRNYSSDPDSPDSAVKLDLGLDTTSHASPVSESGLSSLSSILNDNFNSIKTSPRNSPSSGTKAHTSRVPSAKLRTSVSADFSILQEGRSLGSRSSPAMVVPEGVFGRGMFSTTASSRPGDAFSGEQCDTMADPLTDRDKCDSPQQWVKSRRFDQDRMWPDCRDRQELPLGQTDHARDKNRHHIKKMLSESTTEVQKDIHLNGTTLMSSKRDPLCDEFTIDSNPAGTQSSNKCTTPPHQPKPPSMPRNSKPVTHLRRAPFLSKTQPPMSHCSDEKKDLSQPGEFCAFPDPYLALTETFSCLRSDDWEKKMEGMRLLRRLAFYHSDTLQGKLPEVCLCLSQEVNNLRSVVCSFAVDTLGYLYSHLQKGMDQELEGTVKVLLQKAGQTNNFIRQAVDAALESMMQYCTATRSICALLSVGVSHPNTLVRQCTARHLANLVEKVGAARLLSGMKEPTERILHSVTKFVQDVSPKTRYFGRQMLLSLSSHPNFDKILEKHISGQDLLTIKNIFINLNKEGNKMPPDSQSAKGKRIVPVRGVGNKTEYCEQLTSLLASNDFRDRIKGIDQLLADCQHNSNMVINTIFPVFDAFKDRLLESNSKVNLHALESLPKIISMLKNDMSRVVNILFPAIVDNHLNSKNNAIYSAAVGAINALILHLDRQILVQPFCTKAQFLKGKAKVDLIEKVAELVPEVYPCKPQLVEHKVLPLLWHLLSTSTHKGSTLCRSGSLSSATNKLCQALYVQMGPSLTDLSASQSATVHVLLNDILRMEN
ncbi:TOG array regulator of axonemal microtubules protein 1 [Takifugu flavidus]|uniref:TOG array regulator of axonemal microtubules protein 1 n=1 Tax=Takifugu flavidus TaxID=433684 RepID=A0A5C6NYX5_9TELE|nr:TOG array regulator of axonemal microtubules protein 1 [Takifugu flavidus]